MPADLQKPFGESCCDGGAGSNDNSCQPCGCDKGAGHMCQWHQAAKTDDEIVTANVAFAASTGTRAQVIPVEAFGIKDSGKREQFSGGMVRDTADGKTNYLLTADGPMLRRWADHLTKGAKKYAKRNWMLAEGVEELERAKESAFRHFMQWLNGDTDEDHAAAVFFNINEAEYVKGKTR